MNEKPRKIMKLILFLMCIGCLGMYGILKYQSFCAREEYANAKELAVEKEVEEIEAPVQQEAKSEPVMKLVWQEMKVTDDPVMNEVERIDIDSLRKINEDVIGWIEIPDTPVSYPLVKGTDNEYYLEHTWEGEKNSAGSVFMEEYCNENFEDFHTILYSHRMLDESMFGSLKHYKDQGYLEKHPYIYIKDDQGVHRYEVFAVYEAAVDSMTYAIQIEQEEIKQEFIEHCLNSTTVDTGIQPETTDRILTLSTCTGKGYSKRLVVQARLHFVEEMIIIQ